MSNYRNKKYKILELINTRYSKDEAKALRKSIPNELCISERAFNNWLYLKLDDATEISYRNLYKLAVFFDTSIEELVNFDIKLPKVQVRTQKTI